MADIRNNSDKYFVLDLLMIMLRHENIRLIGMKFIRIQKPREDFEHWQELRKYKANELSVGC